MIGASIVYFAQVNLSSCLEECSPDSTIPYGLSICLSEEEFITRGFLSSQTFLFRSDYTEERDKVNSRASLGSVFDI